MRVMNAVGQRDGTHTCTDRQQQGANTHTHTKALKRTASLITNRIIHDSFSIISARVFLPLINVTD